MVDTERFHLGPHTVQAVGGIATALGADRPTHALEIATQVPLDVESISRILDALEAEGIVEFYVDDDGLKRVRVLQPEPYREIAATVRGGTHIEEPGLVRNLAALRADPEWCRKVRDQHRVLRAVTSLGPKTDLERLVSASDVPSARVRSLLGDLETEGYVLTEYDVGTDVMRVRFPPITYPKARFERNTAMLTTLPAKSADLTWVWWAALIAAGCLLALFVGLLFM